MFWGVFRSVFYLSVVCLSFVCLSVVVQSGVCLWGLCPSELCFCCPSFVYLFVSSLSVIYLSDG